MDLLKKLITIDREADQPVYLQIANAFIGNICRGRLRKGLKLPGSRQLAELLDLNRMTVVSAYDELQAQGWIESIPRKGTFVRQNLPDINLQKISEEKEIGHFPEKAAFPINEKRIIVFPRPIIRNRDKLIINDGFPDIRLTPLEPLIRSMRSLSRKPIFRKSLRYGNPLGTEELRQTLAVFLSDTRGLPISTKNIMITRGAQMGINLAGGLLIQPGDHVIVGEPSYFGATLSLKQNGAVINRVPVDGDGMDVDAVEELCKKKKIRLLYAIPHHHHPTTVTLTPERRIRLLELAEKYTFAIIEDDYDYDFHYTSSPMLPMASLDQRGSVIYIGTLTKTLAPAIRIGFMVGAENIIAAAANLRRTMDLQGDSLLEVAIAELYNGGTIERHIRKSVKLYRKRRDCFCYLLKTRLGDRVSFNIPDGGMSVWTEFMGVNLETLSTAAYQKGLVISDGQEYNSDNKNYNAIRMGFASLNLEEQKKAVDILADCI